jgi:hypothetical protein
VRERKPREFQEKAGAAFDALFDEDQQEQLITLTQREDGVLEQGSALQAWLLEEHLRADAVAGPAAAEGIRCPKCRRLGVRDSGEKEPVPPVADDACREAGTAALGIQDLPRRARRTRTLKC